MEDFVRQIEAKLLKLSVAEQADLAEAIATIRALSPKLSGIEISTVLPEVMPVITQASAGMSPTGAITELFLQAEGAAKRTGCSRALAIFGAR
jgi:hypothetical protein